MRMLDFQDNNKVNVKIDWNMPEMANNRPVEFDVAAETPAAKHLFDVNICAEQLDSGKAATFHHLAAKCLFLCKRARLSLQLASAFSS